MENNSIKLGVVFASTLLGNILSRIELAIVTGLSFGLITAICVWISKQILPSLDPDMQPFLITFLSIIGTLIGLIFGPLKEGSLIIWKLSTPSQKSIKNYKEKEVKRLRIIILENETEIGALKRENEKELYGILGDSLNPKNFNALVQDKLRTATANLAMQIKGGQLPSYGDVFMAAKNTAGEIGQLSDKLNRVDSQLAATRSEYEKYDKGLNSSAIEFEARKKILDAVRNNRPIDENTNYFDDALSNMGSEALNYKGTSPVNYLPEEKRKLTGRFKERNSVGKTSEFDWDTEMYPAVYDIKNNGENKAPDISVRSEPSGLKDESGNDIPMMSQQAYQRYAIMPSKRKELDAAITEKYGNIPLNSPQADKLRRVAAYQEAELNKPIINRKRVEMQPVPHVSVNVNGKGNGELTVNDVYGEIDNDLAKWEKQGSSSMMPFQNLSQNAKDVLIPKLQLNQKALDDGGAVNTEDLKLVRGNDGALRVFKSDGDYVMDIGKKNTNLKANQPLGVKAKTEVVKQGEAKTAKHPLPAGQARTRKQNGFTYTWNEQTGEYE